MKFKDLKIGTKVLFLQSFLIGCLALISVFSIKGSRSINENIQTLKTEVMDVEKLLSEVKIIYSKIQNHSKSYFLSTFSKGRTTERFSVYGRQPGRWSGRDQFRFSAG